MYRTGGQMLIPVGEANHLKRLKKIEKRIQNLKSSSFPLVTPIMVPLVGSVPSVILRLVAKIILSRLSASLLTSFPVAVEEMQVNGKCAVKEIIWGSNLYLGTRGNFNTLPFVLLLLDLKFLQFDTQF
jgi:hypothetical protein